MPDRPVFCGQFGRRPSSPTLAGVDCVMLPSVWRCLDCAVFCSVSLLMMLFPPTPLRSRGGVVGVVPPRRPIICRCFETPPIPTTPQFQVKHVRLTCGVMLPRVWWCLGCAVFCSGSWLMWLFPPTPLRSRSGVVGVVPSRRPIICRYLRLRRLQRVRNFTSRTCV